MKLPKKSLGIYFRGKYGDGKVKYDIFNSGLDEYSSLSLRAGQDYMYAVIRNELMQDICVEESEECISQHGEYCVLCINGEYFGLYCLKENINDKYFASVTGVNPNSVVTYKGQIYAESDFGRMLDFVIQNKMSEKENYDKACSMFDMDSFIDWVIFEGYCGNSDTINNIKYFSSPDYEDGRYHWYFFDLDWSFQTEYFAMNNIFYGEGNAGYQPTAMLNNLKYNSEFREKFLTRFAYLIKTCLSDESVLKRIDEMVSYVDSEVVYDRERWNQSYPDFKVRVNDLKNIISGFDYANTCIERVCRYFDVTDEERVFYFE